MKTAIFEFLIIKIPSKILKGWCLFKNRLGTKTLSFDRAILHFNGEATKECTLTITCHSLLIVQTTLMR